MDRAAILREFRTGSAARATAAASAWVQANPGDEDMLEALAGGLSRTGYVHAAADLFAALTALDATPSRLTGLALARSALGAAEEAHALFLDALAVDPLHTGAWAGLAEVHRFEEGDPLLDALTRALQAAKAWGPGGRDHAARLSYVLCKAMNDMGRWSDAWRLAEEGAALTDAPYDPAPLRMWEADQRAVVTPELLAAKAQHGVSSDRLVFIVGLPRCGSSLLEAMLSRLPGVAPCGELTFVPELAQARAERGVRAGGPHPTHAWLRDWPQEEIAALARAYVQDQEARARAAGTWAPDGPAPRIFIDKGLENIACLPHLAILFPRARILRMRRDPRDACVSMLLGRFAQGGAAALTPDRAAEAWAIRQRMADRMTPLLPNPVMDVSYEALVSRTEQVMRAAVGFLDLDWDPACLSPEGATAPCATRSRGEVRKPVHGGSVRRWRRYGAHAAPLIAALKANGALLPQEAPAASA